jgi:hypothetical protein
MRRSTLLSGLALVAGFALAVPCRAADVTVTLPAVSGAPGTLVSIPITTNPALAGLNVLSVDFRLTFDPAVAQSAQAGSDGTIQNWGPPFANGTSAFFAEAAAGGTALTLPGTLLNTVKFRIKPTAVVGTVMPLTFQHITFNGGTPTVAVVTGTMTVTAPPAGVAPAADAGLALAVLSAPSRSEARFQFTVPAGRGEARLAIHALDGRRIATLANAAGPGSHTLAWDLRDAHGARVRSGLYFVRLALGGESVTRKLVVAG